MRGNVEAYNFLMIEDSGANGSAEMYMCGADSETAMLNVSTNLRASLAQFAMVIFGSSIKVYDEVSQQMPAECSRNALTGICRANEDSAGEATETESSKLRISNQNRSLLLINCFSNAK